MDENYGQIETQREYYDRILKEKDCEIKILEMVIHELVTMFWREKKGE